MIPWELLDSAPVPGSGEALRLYARAGLEAAFAALRPKGVLAVWSAVPDRIFAQRLRCVGFEVDEIRARARGPRGGERRTIWIAERGA